MSLLRPTAKCLTCGHKVRQPKDPSDYVCANCSNPGPWASQDQVAAWKATRAEEGRLASVRAEAQGKATELLGIAAAGGVVSRPDLDAALAAASYSLQDIQKLKADSFAQAAYSATADDIITPEEESHLTQLLAVLALDWSTIGAVHPELPQRISIAAVNGGILPEVASPSILPKKGEKIHVECPASLMKEVTIRQYQGGYSGFSFPIGKTGIRYKVGGSRGHSVEVGTKLNVADTGTLVVSNKRVVYVGTRKTVEMPLAKLVNLNVYSDGIQFHMSNRVNAPLFRMAQGSELVAAIVNSVAQQLDSA